MEDFNREYRIRKPEVGIPSQLQKELLNHKAHKKQKGFNFVSFLNPKTEILNPNSSFCILLFDILFYICLL